MHCFTIYILKQKMIYLGFGERVESTVERALREVRRIAYLAAVFSKLFRINKSLYVDKCLGVGKALEVVSFVYIVRAVAQNKSQVLALDK